MTSIAKNLATTTSTGNRASPPASCIHSTDPHQIAGPRSHYPTRAITGGTEGQAGLYAAAQNMALVPLMLLGAVTPLFLSSLAELKEEHGFETARSLAADVLRLAILMWPLIAVGADG